MGILIMDLCPICKAAWAGKETCHRCKSDLTGFMEIERGAEAELAMAVAAFKEKEYRTAYFHGRRSCSLKRTKQGERLCLYALGLTR